MTLSKPRAIFLAVMALSSWLLWTSFEPISHHAARSAWGAFALLQLCCWSPVLVGRLRVLLPVATTLWLVVMANYLMTPYLNSPSFHEYFSLPKNLHERVRVVGDVMPGFSGVANVTTDEKGFRVNGRIDYEKKEPGTLRIAAIGASTTEQIYLDDHKTWANLLAEELAADTGRKVEMINTGLSGLRALHHLQTFNVVRKYDIDIALFLIGVNDWNAQIRELGRPPTQAWAPFDAFQADRSLLWQVGLRLRSAEAAIASADGARIDDGSFYAKQNDSLMRPEKKEISITAVSRDYQAWVTRIIDQCKASHIRCVFIDQPNAYRAEISPELRRRLWMTPPEESYTLSLDGMRQAANTYNAWITAVVAKSGLEACNIADDIPATTDFFYDDCHFNENGSRRVATLLRKCLEAHSAH